MKLIVGLGNPDKKYDNTRHNVGFMFLDYYVKKKNIEGKWSNKFDGDLLKTKYAGEDVLFLKPLTYMNLSGNSVYKVMNYYDIDIKDLLVISDDLDIFLGNFKIKSNGSCGGHNGLRDIENKIGSSEYKRFKIGISKNSSIDTKDYVLGKFSSEEKDVLNNVFFELSDALDDYFILKFSDLMSKYNKKNR